MTPPNVLLYGATGYMGRLVLQQASDLQASLILGGRSQAVQTLANQLNVPARIFPVQDTDAIIPHLKDVTAVLNVAGPFAHTSYPLAEACIQTQTHYLDIAGEVPEFERLYQLDGAAQQAQVMLMPGVGFGVVPTDVVAYGLKERLPTATHLVLAFATEGGVSQGTLRTVLKDLCKTGVKRVAGQLVSAQPGVKSMTFEVDSQSIAVVSNPWRADLLTAFLSTGIANIETYSAFPAPLPFIMRHGDWFAGMLRSRCLQRLLRQLPAGPSAEELQQGKTYVYGTVTNEQGQQVTATLIGPEAYLFTAQTALAILNRVLAGEIKPGFQTPALTYGTALLESWDTVRINWQLQT